MIVIVSRHALHLLAPGVSGNGFELKGGRNEFASLPHWVRPRLRKFLDAKDSKGEPLMTYEEVLPPAPKKADTEPAPPAEDEDATDAPAEAKRKRR